jgi:hypothetical protein
MNHELKCRIVFMIGTLCLSGCAGYDRILFATKTNVGIDVDNKPPTAEITIARRELAITPTFQDSVEQDNTLPLLASFGLDGGILDPDLSSRFAGGEAAVLLAMGPAKASSAMLNSSVTSDLSSICLNKQPDTRPLWKWLWHWIINKPETERYEQDTRAFYFATDSSFGLKLGWDGTSGPYPDTLKLGYNRKELAFPPIFVTQGCSKSNVSAPTPPPPTTPVVATPVGTAPGPTGPGTATSVVTPAVATPVAVTPVATAPVTAAPAGPGQSPAAPGAATPAATTSVATGWKVTVPSFFASLENSSTAKKGLIDGGVTNIQFFATGKAASEFVRRPDVNAAMNEKMYPHDSLSIDPNHSIVSITGTRAFKVTGGTGQVKYTVMNDTTGGARVDPATGLYTAGPNPGRSTVGVADEAGKTTVATVVVNPALSITPSSQSVNHGTALQFTAIGGVAPYKFSISDNQSGRASIDDKTGLYTAGSSVGKTDKVKVTDSSTPPVSIEATVNVN